MIRLWTVRKKIPPTGFPDRELSWNAPATGPENPEERETETASAGSVPRAGAGDAPRASAGSATVRPEFSVSPDDDLYGSPRSWAGAEIAREKGPQAGARAAGPHSRKNRVPADAVPEVGRGMPLFAAQWLGAAFLAAAAFLVFHSSRPGAVEVQRAIRAALSPDYTSVTLPAAVARAFGSVPSSGKAAVSATAPPVDVVAPLHGRVVRGFSTVAPDVVIAGHPGSSVAAAADGLVTRVGETQASGYFVLVDHGAFGQTFYAGLGRAVVHPHEYVIAGQTVGYLPARSGRLTFGYIRGGSYRDPLQFLGSARP